MISRYDYYNYCVIPFTKEVTRSYNTKNKTELKDIYAAMLKKNKSQPLYKVTLQESSQEYAISVKNSAYNLKSVASELEPTAFNSLLKDLIATSDNSNKVHATIVNQDDASPSQFSISVAQIATPQVNQGILLNDNGRLFMKGEHEIKLETNGNKYRFEFNITEDDTNMTVYNRLAKEVNSLNAGVKASVHSNGEGSSFLELESANPIDPNIDASFRISDIPDPDHSIAYQIISSMHLNQVAVKPQDAKFVLNGDSYTAKSNQLLLDNGVELQLNEATDGEINVYVNKDPKPAKEKVTQFVDHYNHMINLAINNSNTQKSAHKLLHDVSIIAKDYKNELEATGINIEKNGILSIDDSLLEQTIEDSTISGSLEGINKFNNTIIKKSSDIVINPMEYVDKKLIIYTKPEPNFVNVYNPSIYTGMLFNYYL